MTVKERKAVWKKLENFIKEHEEQSFTLKELVNTMWEFFPQHKEDISYNMISAWVTNQASDGKSKYFRYLKDNKIYYIYVNDFILTSVNSKTNYKSKIQAKNSMYYLKNPKERDYKGREYIDKSEDCYLINSSGKILALIPKLYIKCYL